MAVLKTVLVAFGLIYALIAAAMWLFQRQLQYFPNRNDPAPASVGLKGVERVRLVTPDGETLILWRSEPVGDRPMILFFHGNGGSIADRADRLAFYQAQGFGTAFLSYRGYGGSSGRISEAGFIVDAQTAYDHLVTSGVTPMRIAVVGESLGSGVAVQLAARKRIGALVLEAPFTAAVDVARLAYPWLPVRLLMADQFRSDQYIGAVTAPLLILHGEGDRTIPFALGEQLFALAPEPKTFVSLGPAGHEALYIPSTWAKETAFLDRILPP